VTFKLLDLFSGLGGFSLGLERTGCFQTVAFCDNDKYSNLVLQKHWKGVKIYNDVKEITKEKLESDGVELPDIITGGFPCQPFSVAGKQKGTSDDRHLWPEMFRIIKELTPRWIIGENVKGLVNLQDGMVFETVCTDLEGEGYEVRAFNIPAAGVGAPHRRERIWIVANSRRALRQRTELRETNEDETREGYADQHQRSGSASESNVANAKSEQSHSSNNEQESRKTCQSKQVELGGRDSGSLWPTNWEFEPDVGRVAHGVSGRVYRLKGLGNSIVPQIAEEIGKAIIEAERLNEMCLYNS
jgi:DNA (cytosine-5)-methyltransferase 1